MNIVDKYERLVDLAERLEDEQEAIAERLDDINNKLEELETEWLKTHVCACELLGTYPCEHQEIDDNG